MTHANELSTRTTVPTAQTGRAPAPLSRRDLANCVRVLAMDAVQHARSGHPGMPMGMADIIEVLNQAQAALLHRATCNSDAARAGYDPKLDRNPA